MSKRVRIIALVLLLLLALIGCGARQDVAFEGDSLAAPSSMQYSQDMATDDYLGIEPIEMRGEQSDGQQKVISRASVRVEVERIAQTVDSIYSLSRELAGQIQSSSIWKSNESEHASLVLRIPAEEFENALQRLGEFGEVTRTDISSQDVTEEYIDLEARLSMLERQQETYLRLLDKAENIEETLKVEKELERVIYEIERTTGRLQFLQRNIAMSTISIELVSPKRPTSPEVNNIGTRLRYALQDGWGVFLNVVTGLAVGLIWMLPFLPFVALVVALIRWLWKKRAAKRNIGG